MHKFFESWLRCRVQVMDAGRAEGQEFLSIFLEKCPLCPLKGMFCVRFWVVPGRFSMMSVGLGGGVRLCGWRWLIREGHEFSRKTGAAGRWPDGGRWSARPRRLAGARGERANYELSCAFAGVLRVVSGGATMLASRRSRFYLGLLSSRICDDGAMGRSGIGLPLW